MRANYSFKGVGSVSLVGSLAFICIGGMNSPYLFSFVGVGGVTIAGSNSLVSICGVAYGKYLCGRDTGTN